MRLTNSHIVVALPLVLEVRDFAAAPTGHRSAPEPLRPARQTPRPVLLQRQAAECRPTSSRRRRRRPTARSLPGWRGGCSTVSTFTCWTQTCRRASSPCTSRHSIMMAFVSHCEWANAHREGPVGYAPIASTQIPAPQIPPFPPDADPPPPGPPSLPPYPPSKAPTPPPGSPPFPPRAAPTPRVRQNRK